ncbi:MAG: DUF58 domain-containing protein [Nevskiales bacterium]
MLTSPRQYIRRRIREYIFRRIRRVPGPVLIRRQRIYIVPTRFGYLFGLMVFVMLLGSMNYSNSMGFALAFLLTGLGLVCMHHTHRNLVNLSVRAGRHAPVFAGHNAQFQIVLDNAAAAHRYALVSSLVEIETEPVYFDVPARGHALAFLLLPAARRGLLAAPSFRIYTEYPIGLFHAWTWMELEMQCVVYPAPAENRLQPPPTRGGDSGRADRIGGKEDFIGLRSYQRGDASRLIHWKTLPRSGQLMVKQFADPVQHELWLDWDSLPGLETEARLSQLCRWVLDAHRAGKSYGLALPGLKLPPASSEQHRHECLEALALFNPASTTT